MVVITVVVMVVIVIVVVPSDWPQVMLKCEATYLLALLQSALTRRAEVEADPDPRVTNFFRRLREALIRAPTATNSIGSINLSLRFRTI
jgi:hypothetical protein